MAVVYQWIILSVLYFGSITALDPCQRQPFYSTCHTWPDGPGRPYRSQVVMRFYHLGGECTSYPYGLCKNDVSAAKLFRYKQQCEKACFNDGNNITTDSILLPPPISFIAEVASIKVEPRYDISTAGNGSAGNQGGVRDEHDVKPGICPFPEAGEYAVCVRECHLDHECPRNFKCCYNGCGRLCLEPKLIKGDPCNHAVDHGGCYGYFRRWWYDSGINACKQFIYGGCGGSGNNFMSESVCMDTCWNPGQPGANRPAPRLDTSSTRTTTAKPTPKVSKTHVSDRVTPSPATVAPLSTSSTTPKNTADSNDPLATCIEIPLADGSVFRIGYGCSTTTTETTPSLDLTSTPVLDTSTPTPTNSTPIPVCINVPLPDGTVYHIGANCTSEENPVPASLTLASNESFSKSYNTSDLSDHVSRMLDKMSANDLPVAIPFCFDIPLADGTILHIGWQCTTTSSTISTSTISTSTTPSSTTPTSSATSTTTTVSALRSSTAQSTRHPETTGITRHTTSGSTGKSPLTTIRHFGGTTTIPKDEKSTKSLPVTATLPPKSSPTTPLSICIDIPLPDGTIYHIGANCTTDQTTTSSVQPSPAVENAIPKTTPTPNSHLRTSENTTIWVTPIHPSPPHENETSLISNNTGAVVAQWTYQGFQSNETADVKPKPFPVYGGGPGWSPVLGRFAPSAVYIPASSLGGTPRGPPGFLAISNKTHPDGPGFETGSNNTNASGSGFERANQTHANGSESEIANTTDTSITTLTPPPIRDRTGKGYIVPQIHNVVQPHTSPYLPHTGPTRIPELAEPTISPGSVTPTPALPPKNSSVFCPHNWRPLTTPQGVIVTCLPSPFDRDLRCPKNWTCFFGGLNFYCCPDAEVVFPMGKKELQEKKEEEKPELREEEVGFLQRVSQSKDKKPEKTNPEKLESWVGRRSDV